MEEKDLSKIFVNGKFCLLAIDGMDEDISENDISIFWSIYDDIECCPRRFLSSFNLYFEDGKNECDPPIFRLGFMWDKLDDDRRIVFLISSKDKHIDPNEVNFLNYLTNAYSIENPEKTYIVIGSYSDNLSISSPWANCSTISSSSFKEAINTITNIDANTMTAMHMFALCHYNINCIIGAGESHIFTNKSLKDIFNEFIKDMK